MWRALAVIGIGCAITACGGRSRQGNDSNPPAGGGPPVGVGPQAEQGCFPVTVLSDVQMRQVLVAKLGVTLAVDSVDMSEPDALVRGQQLVDAVDSALEAQAVPLQSREILRSFVGGLVGEDTFALPAALSNDERFNLQQQFDRFVDDWMVGQRGSLDVLLTGSLDPAGPPREQRAGIMTLGAFLVRVPSPPQRGMHLAEQLACVMVPPPPLIESEWSKEPQRPAKAIVEQTYGNEQVVCVACHTHYIGYAIALDRYDALGRYRESLNGAAIDTSYSLTMPVYEPRPAPNDGTAVPFAAPAELGRALSQAGGARACLVRKLNEQLGGSELSETELSCVLEKLAAEQGNFRSVLAMLAPRLLGAP